MSLNGTKPVGVWIDEDNFYRPYVGSKILDPVPTLEQAYQNLSDYWQEEYGKSIKEESAPF